jgi:hypothetical protein
MDRRRTPLSTFLLSSCALIFLFDRFLRHPWSNLTSTFLNFEGAGAGGYVRSPRVFSVLTPFPLVAPFSSDRHRMTSSKPSAQHRISIPTLFLKTLGIEASSVQTRITPSILPLGPVTFPRTLQEMIRQPVPSLTGIKAQGAACKARTLPFIPHGRGTILWRTRSAEWAMRVRGGHFGRC